MARKESISKVDILTSAFEMTCEEGWEQVTARKLAQRAGCSTQPIFRSYKSMEELGDDIFIMAKDYFSEYASPYQDYHITPFVSLGLAYINFAKEHKQLFRLLFLNKDRKGSSFYDILNGHYDVVVHEVNNATRMGIKDPQGMFMRMWIFIHGTACMCLTDDYDLDKKQTAQLLAETYRAFDREGNV